MTSKVNGVTSVLPLHLDDRLFNRRQRQEQRLATVRESAEKQHQLQEKYFDELVSDVQENSSSQHSDSLPSSILRAQNLAAKQEASELNANEINHIFSHYVNEAEIDVIFDYFEQEQLNHERAEHILEEVLASSEELVDSTLDQALKAHAFSLAEIYAVLLYIKDQVAKREQHRVRLLKLLQMLLQKFEQQHSAYLFEFFQIAKHPQVQRQPKLASGIANLASGRLQLINLKSTLTFIEDYLDGDFSNLVSRCISLRSNLLARLLQQKLNFEHKSELGQFIKLEQSLITVNSLYNKMQMFKQSLAKGRVWQLELGDDYAQLLKASLTFCEGSVVTELAIRNLLVGFGVLQPQTVKVGFRHKLIQLFASFPLVVFNNVAQHKEKVIDGIRRSYANSQLESEERLFDFLDTARTQIEYI